jgi:hypothetical protein
MICTDPFVNYLKSFGYNIIRLPKADVKPLQIMTRQGKDLDRLGDLATLLVAGENITLPTAIENEPSANISGQRTSDLKAGIGLSILGTIIGAMGGSKLGLDVKYKQAKTIAFEFSDVLGDRVEIARLDQYLADADVSPFSRYVAELLEADEVYVITATLKSKKFAVEAKRSDGVSLDVSIPEIQGVVGGSVAVSGQSDVTSRVSYEGSVPLVFGFQAVRLYYDDGRYTAFEPIDSDTAARALDQAPADGARRLMTEGPFLRLGDV